MAASMFLETNEIPGDPGFRARVDALAACSQVESEAIGYAGAPSEVFARFEAVASAASPAQMLALLRHESPVIRLYAARHVASTPGSDVEPLEPLLSDHTRVTAQDGCIVHTQRMSEHVLFLLSGLDGRPSVVRLLRAACAMGSLGPGRFVAMAALRRWQPEEVTAMTSAIVRSRDQPAEDIVAAFPLWRASGPDRASLFEVVGGLVDHPDPAVRQLLPGHLAEIGDRASLSLLQALQRDRHAGVAASADHAYPAHPLAEPSAVEALVAEYGRRWGNNLFLSSLVHSDNPAILEMLVRAIRAAEVHANTCSLIQSRRPSEAFTRVARQLATFDSPGVYFGQSPRSAALDYLIRLRAPGALQVCRQTFIDSQQSGTWNVAAAGIVSLLTDGTEKTLLPLLKDQDVLVRRQAIRELGAVGGKLALAQLEKALPSLESGDRVEADAALQHLRARLSRGS